MASIKNHSRFGSLVLVLAMAMVTVLGLGVSHRASALTVSPPLVEVDLNPGNTIEKEITITNETKFEQTYYLTAENFKAKGEDGSPSFDEKPEIGQVGYGLAQWISFPVKAVTLKPGDIRKVAVNINLPQIIQPGGYYASVFFSTNPPEGAKGGEVAIGSQVGVLFLLNVPGDVKESAAISTFDLDPSGKTWFSSLPFSTLTRITNGGNSHFKPLGQVVADGWFNSVSANFNEIGGNILPGSVRRFNVQVGEDNLDRSFFGQVKYQWNHFAFGRYAVYPELHFGKNNTVLTAPALHVWIMPWQLIFLILVILGAATAFVIYYNKLIVERAQKKSAPAKK